MAKVTKKKAGRRKLRGGIVGRKGSITFGQSKVKVVVVEDRGPIGNAGRRLVRVRYDNPETDPSTSFEIPMEELVLTAARG